MMKNKTPITRTELITKARMLAGWTIQQFADHLNVTVPKDLRKHKGWFGQLLECYLGATAGSLPEPDFQELNVELKTIPVNAQGRPVESTYVCVVPLTSIGHEQWRESLVWRKLQCVLWVPVEGDTNISVAQRRILTAHLWQPSALQEEQLRTDWEEFAERIAIGEVDTISASLGEVLQVRPKAANAKTTCEGIAADGTHQLTLPRGFYLRPSFTSEILCTHPMY